MKEQLAAIQNPAARLAIVRTSVLTELALSDSLKVPLPGETLVAWIELATEAANDLRSQLATADASLLPRWSVDDLVRVLALFVFRELVPDFSLERMDCGVHRSRSELSTAQRQVVSMFETLLQAMNHWSLGFYERCPLHIALRALPDEDRRAFAAGCEELALGFHEIYGMNPSSAPVKEAQSRRTNALDRLRELRTLALAAASRAAVGVPNHAECHDVFPSSGNLHWLEVGMVNDRRTFAALGLEREAIHLWCSSGWCRDAAPLVEMTGNPDLSLEQWNSAILKFRSSHAIGLADIFADHQEPSRLETIRIADHTRWGLPLSCLLDGQRRYCCPTALPRKSAPLREPVDRRISFWGQLQYGANERLTAEEDRREVLNDSQLCLVFPHAAAEPIRIRGNPRPLPYAYFERWFLEDAAKTYDLDLHCHCAHGPTRNAFLDQAAAGGGVLHITTHGQADGTDIECSRLLFAGHENRPTFVHLFDILSRDWSNYDLIVLNSCLTSAGKKRLGEEVLSLAWAFLAGRARAVIGCRWPVDDKVAWEFCWQFYQRYYDPRCERSTRLHSAFADAVRSIRQERPGDWGAFALLT